MKKILSISSLVLFALALVFVSVPKVNAASSTVDSNTSTDVTTPDTTSTGSTSDTPVDTSVTATTHAATVYTFGKTLVKKGSKGDACKAWQEYFNKKGHASLVVDGNCGAKTIAFAKKWQASVHLKADGILGAMSRAKAI